MNIEDYLYKENVIITDSSNKRNLLELFSDKFISAKIYSYDELIKNIIEIDYNYKLELGKKYDFEFVDIISTYFNFVKDSAVEKKTKTVFDAKKEVKNYFTLNKELISFIKCKNLILYNFYDYYKDEELILNEYFDINNSIRINEDVSFKNKLNINKFKTAEEEVAYISEQVLFLLKTVSPNNIFIHISNAEYKNIIKRIFTQFNIPYMTRNESSLISYDMTSYFLELFKKDSEIEEILEILRQTYNFQNSKNSIIYNSIVDVLNKFDIKKSESTFDLLEYEFSKYIPKFKFDNVVTEINIDEKVFKDNDYVFLLGFNQNYFPSISGNNDYLDDKEKELLNLKSSIMENKIREKKCFAIVNQIKNLYISFSKSIKGEDMVVSPLVEILQDKSEVDIIENNYNYSSENYNKYLLSKNHYNYKKFNEISKEYTFLLGNYKNDFKLYDNKYKKIEIEKLSEFLNNSLVLSYSSLDNFHKCSFKFYINNILKIREDNIDTPSIIVGKIVHSVLCELAKNNFSIDEEEIVLNELNKYFHENLNKKQVFYKEKYKKAISELICILRNQMENTNFKNEFLEEEFILTIDGKLKVNLKGYIDKVMTFDDGKNIYLVIVDYKTGTIDVNLNPVIYGLNAQLCIYYYLLSKKIKNSKLMGIYYQNIIKDVLSFKEGKKYDELLKDEYRLNGYTSKETTVLNEFDKDLSESFVKGLKITKEGAFYSNSKVFSEDQLKKLLDITEKNIKAAIKKIENAEFDINPKKIGVDDDVTGCKYCKYKDICFKKDEDIKYLREYKKLEFLGGDEDE
jgi:ATP-dependent nuclease, subunit B